MNSKLRETELKKLLANLKNVDLYRSCITCSYFEGARNINDDHSKQSRCAKHCGNPPSFIIANGCDDYVDYSDDVPF